MRIPCPHCGMRDLREFTIRGAALTRPAPGAPMDDWDAYVHLRDNPAGPSREHWQHSAGCGAWLIVTRDTATHEVIGAAFASEGAGA